MPRKKIISLDIDLVTYSDALETIIQRARHSTPGYVCFANVHMIVEAYKDRSFAQQVNNATLAVADGMPLVKSMKWLYGLRLERIAGMDAFSDLLRLAEINHLKVFFFGTTDTILELLTQKARHQFPGLRIAGSLAPPFHKSLDDEEYSDIINKARANLVFVALGCPKQEKWMATHSSKINGVLLGVGGAFPVFAGTTKRAPAWMRNASLEWLFRLAQEPKRLFKRYLVTNSLYVSLLIKEKLKMRNASNK